MPRICSMSARSPTTAAAPRSTRPRTASSRLLLRVWTTTSCPSSSSVCAASRPRPSAEPVMKTRAISTHYRSTRRRLRAQKRLDRSPFVHRLVAGGGVLKRQFEVEDLSWVDLAVPDQVDELGQEAAHRGGPSVEVGKAPEQLHPGQRDLVTDADEADVA